MKPVHVHFVCTGNVYRSRLAEAYLRSKQIPNIDVSSSGIKAQENTNGPISWYAMRIVKRNDLVDNLKHSWTQATPKLLNSVDIVIFMTDDQYQYAKTHFTYKKTSYEIWNIKDLDDLGFLDSQKRLDMDIARIKETEKAFEEIKKKVDALAAKLTHANH